MDVNGDGLKSLFNYWRRMMAENREFLIDMDSIIGDGDLGLTMSDGFTAAHNAISGSEETDAGILCYLAGKAMSTAVPSTMGTLMASGLMQAGKALRGRKTLALSDFADMFEAYMQGVATRGRAKPGEKTFLDGMAPAVASLISDAALGRSISVSASNAAVAAVAGYENTRTMLAVHGRAATRGEKSRELLDPGAAVAMLIMKAFSQFCHDL